MKADYNQILELIHKLSEREIEKLTITLQSEMSSKKTSNSIQKLILKAPTWSDSDFDDYKKVRY